LRIKENLTRTSVKILNKDIKSEIFYLEKSQPPTIYKNNAQTCFELKLPARLQRPIVLRTINLARSQGFYWLRFKNFIEMDKKDNFIDTTMKKISLAICTALGLFFLYEHFANPEITEEKDLTTLNVVLEDFTFERYEDLSRRSPNYYIKTFEYNNLFKVASDDIWLFNMRKFESDSLKNKPVQVKISNEEKAYLNQTGHFVSLYEISKGNHIYLSSKETLRENQGPISLITSIGLFAFAGFIAILLKRESVK